MSRSPDGLDALSRPPAMIVPRERIAEFNEWCQDNQVPEASLNRWDSAYLAVQERFLEDCRD